MTNTLKVGLDIHGVIDTFPQRFKLLSKALVKDGAEVHIVTGSKRDDRINQLLNDAGIFFTHYFSIVEHLEASDTQVKWHQGLPYANEEKWNRAKRDYCEQQGIHLMFDDSPIYLETFHDIDTTYLHVINQGRNAKTQNINASRIERFEGCLLGLAVGDALGTTLEFKTRGSFAPITDMLGGGPFKLKPGEWTDDTSMALCLAHSLVNRKGFDAVDQMNRYCDWWQNGYMSSNGKCFDIGVTVTAALHRYLENRVPYSGSTEPNTAGNGSLMRLAPVAMYYSRKVEDVIHYSGESSKTTHACAECVDACRYFGSMLYSALSGEDKVTILNSLHFQPKTEKVQAIAKGDYLTKSEAEISGSGYVIKSLEAALWCFATTDSYDQAVLKAANLGEDADTTAAITGQLAGAYYGVKAINPNWIKRLVMRDSITKLANALAEG